MFLHYFRPKHLLSVYLMGGFAGATLFMLAYNLVPALRMQPAWLLGASAGVTAISVAMAAYRPNLQINLLIFGPVKIKYLVLIMIALDFVNIQNGQNIGGHFSHIGGAVLGFLFGNQMLINNDITREFTKLIETIVSLFSQKKRALHLHKPINDRDRDLIANAHRRANQAEIDRILDKISKSGYDSLTTDEKDKLFRAGN
jgi:hypothetical protein